MHEIYFKSSESNYVFGLVPYTLIPLACCKHYECFESSIQQYNYQQHFIQVRE